MIKDRINTVRFVNIQSRIFYLLINIGFTILAMINQ